MASPQDRYRRLAAASLAFTPGSPIDSLAVFSGRIEEVRDILNVLGQRGQHVALYGERGVGKTSIASILAEALEQRPRGRKPRSARVGCSSRDNFQSIWRTIFKKLEIDAPEDEITPESIYGHLTGLQDRTLIVIDELDRLDDMEGLSLLSDTIKMLSDNPVKAMIVLVGVADSIDDLVGDHKSVARALRQVRIPRMKTSELEGIVDKGLGKLGLKISPDDRSRIARLSEGLPHYTHALALYASERAIENDRDAINSDDIAAATDLVVKKSQHTTLSAFNRATRSAHKDVLYEKVLLACALAKKDELGLFTAGNVVKPLSIIMGKQYDIPAFARHLKKFTSDERGKILQKHGEARRFFYRFDDPMMQPFVILNGLSKRLITEEKLREIKREVGETPDPNLFSFPTAFERPRGQSGPSSPQEEPEL